MEDVEKIRQFIKDKSMALMSHEKKNYAQIGFPRSNYRVYKIKGRVFYSVEANIFKSIIDDILLEVIQKFLQNFGNGNAVSVIEAINQTEHLYDEIEDVNLPTHFKTRDSCPRHPALKKSHPLIPPKSNASAPAPTSLSSFPKSYFPANGYSWSYCFLSC